MFRNPQVRDFHENLNTRWAQNEGITLPEQRRLQEEGRRDDPCAPGCEYQAMELGGIKVERIMPPDAIGDAALFWLHGGGHVMGNLNTHRPMCSHYAAASRLPLYNVDFRLAPEHPFPADLDDALSAYRGLLDTGMSPERVVIAGDSGGGGLAAALILKIREDGLPMPRGLYLLSPWLDMSGEGESYDLVKDPIVTRAGILHTGGLYLNGQPDTIYTSPIKADPAGFPPTFIHVSSEESFLSDALTFTTKASLAKVDLWLRVEPEMPHAWPIFLPRIDHGHVAIKEAGDWMRTMLGE